MNLYPLFAFKQIKYVFQYILNSFKNNNNMKPIFKMANHKNERKELKNKLKV